MADRATEKHKESRSHIAAHARISQYNPCRFESKRNSELLVTLGVGLIWQKHYDVTG
jgi:hypothetical protein